MRQVCVQVSNRFADQDSPIQNLSMAIGWQLDPLTAVANC
jgi:hypothetical protein